MGIDPLKDPQGLTVDICRPPVYKTGRAEGLDARVGANCSDAMGMFDKPNSGWYTVDFLPAGFQSVNLGGNTQFRLRMDEVPNRDAARAYIQFYNGQGDQANSPLLLVRYHLP